MPWLRFLPVFSTTFHVIDDTVSVVHRYLDRLIKERIDRRRLAKEVIGPNPQNFDPSLENGGSFDYVSLFIDRIEEAAVEQKLDQTNGPNYFE